MAPSDKPAWQSTLTSAIIHALPNPGELIAGKYEVVRLLGKGGMGAVFEVFHRKLDQRFAVKLLLPDFMSSHEAVARFEREARASARLRSRHVVRVTDVDSDTARGGLPFMVMEYLEGHDLAAELKVRGALPVPEAVDLLLQATLGVHEAHARGIIHRDLKPSNLFLTTNEQGTSVKVMDFGISKLAHEEGEHELTGADATLGTLNYMAPEQLLASKSVDHRVDLWSLGVVLYRALTGMLPYSASSQTALAISIATQKPTPITDRSPEIPHALAHAIMNALSHDREKRPPDAISFARLLEQFGSGRVSVTAELATMPESSPKLPVAPANFGVTTPLAPRVALPAGPAVGQAHVESSTAAMGNVVVARASTPPSRRLGPAAAAAALGVVVALGAGGLAMKLRRAPPPSRDRESAGLVSPPPSIAPVVALPSAPTETAAPVAPTVSAASASSAPSSGPPVATPPSSSPQRSSRSPPKPGPSSAPVPPSAPAKPTAPTADPLHL